jgi:hypothetical protein
LLPLHFGTSQLQTLREEENKSTETINRKLNKQAKEKKKIVVQKTRFFLLENCSSAARHEFNWDNGSNRG